MKLKQLSLGLMFLMLIGGASVEALEVGQTVPAFSLPTLKGNQATTLQQFAGKVIYLDFWASWCAPCRVSFPLLNKLHQKLKAQGFEVIAINLDEDASKAEQFLKDYPVEFTVLRDAEGGWADKFAVESMPTSFIIDKHGVVQKIHSGFSSDDVKELEAKITELLALK